MKTCSTCFHASEGVCWHGTHPHGEVAGDYICERWCPCPFPYQWEGARLLAQRGRQVLADSTRIGKTCQCILACRMARVETAVVVCRQTLMYNWVDQINMWAPGTNVFVATGTAEKRAKVIERFFAEGGFLIINYEVLYPRWLPEDKKERKSSRRRYFSTIDEFWDERWDVLIYDEPHKYVLNRKSDPFWSVVEMCKRARGLFLVTATPILNEVMDIWHYLHLLDPKKFNSYWNFAKEYAGARPPSPNPRHREYGWQINRQAANPEKLKALLASYVIQRTKEEVRHDLPPKVYEEVVLQMDEEQSRLYFQMEEHMVTMADGRFVVAATPLSQTTRLKQVATCPRLVGGRSRGVKLEWLLEFLEEVSDEEKVVVYSQFGVALDELEETFRDQGVEFSWDRLHSDLDAKQRFTLARDFNTNNARVFLSTIDLGGEGIDLAGAGTAVFLDRLWTPARNDQACDRLCGPGQKSYARIIDLICKDTIEDYIERLNRDKTLTVEDVMKAMNSKYSRRKEE